MIRQHLAFWCFVLGLIAMASLTGCSTKQEPCYGLVGVNPQTRTAILFDACRGEVFYQNLPPMSAVRAQPEA